MKLKVKTLYCCWKTCIAGLRRSKAERAAVGSVALSPLHQTACSALPHLQQSTSITEPLLPEVEAWCVPRGSLGYALHRMGSGRACRELWESENSLFLLCKSLETWMCAVLLKARGVPGCCRRSSMSRMSVCQRNEWQCGWVPFPSHRAVWVQKGHKQEL